MYLLATVTGLLWYASDNAMQSGILVVENTAETDAVPVSYELTWPVFDDTVPAAETLLVGFQTLPTHTVHRRSLNYMS